MERQVSRKKVSSKTKKTGWVKVSLIIAALVFIVLPVYLLNQLSDSYVLVEETAILNADSATKAKNIANKVYSDLVSTDATEQFEIVLTENDINGVVALAMRGIKNLKGRVNVTPVGIRGAFSFPTPRNPLGDYLNVSGTIVLSSNGFYVEDVSIGRMNISGEVAVSLIENILNLLLGGENVGTRLLTSIDSVAVSGSTLSVKYHSVPDLKQAIKQTKSKVKSIRNDLTILASPEDVKLYYLNLCNLHTRISDFNDVSLAYYLSDSFVFASQKNSISQQPREENKAAILALAIFLGSPEFDSFIGAIDDVTFERCQPKKDNIVLAERNDLRLHFIFSAALKIISDSSISFAIGEFKELLDSGKGGTGFSFTDLAADRSGIYFTEFALSKRGATQLQRSASNLTQEDMFFPDLTGLPDGISQQQFDKIGGFDGQFYQKRLATINRRIERLPLYQ